MPRWFLLCPLLLGCPAGGEATGPAVEDWSGTMEALDLAVELADRRAVATLAVRPSESGSFSLQIGALSDLEVTADAELQWAEQAGRLDLGLPPDQIASVTVEYGFPVADRFEGWMKSGSTVTWPESCGNLFPCRPHPAAGHPWRLDVVGDGVVFAPQVDGAPPAYQLAWAQGDYAVLDAGTTDGGVELVVHHSPANAVRAAEGAASLAGHLSWLEDLLGPYPFGDRAGAVEVDWGAGYGGIEHHPLWHISSVALHDPLVHAHEAVHAWFGDGVRLRCWEDLTLSEGVATYLAARVTGAVDGEAAEAEVWADYESELIGLGGVGSRLAWVEDCGVEDPSSGALSTRAPYIKGALFLRALGEDSSRAAVDAALGSFVRQHLGEAVGVDDLLAHLDAALGLDTRPLAEAWLLSTSVPP